jgi:hypothetical protein
MFHFLPISRIPLTLPPDGWGRGLEYAFASTDTHASMTARRLAFFAVGCFRIIRRCTLVHGFPTSSRKPMALNPLAPVTDYQSLLNRIFWFTSVAALGAISLLEANVPTIRAALVSFDQALAAGFVEKLPIRASYLLPALSVALLARVFRLHGQLSHWLGISEQFDAKIIMPEFARQLGVDPVTIPEQQWLDHRQEVMRQAFYRFTSSDSPGIDRHLIHQALDLWSWFWAGLQSAVVFSLTSFILIATQSYRAGSATLGITLLLTAFGLPAIRHSCRRYAIAQVNAILADPARAEAVRQAFRWIELAPHEHLRAA